MVKYFDRNCKPITEEKWKELKQNRAYCKVGEYADSQFHVFVGWNGRIENADKLFRTSYPLFDSFIMQFDDATQSWSEAPDSGKTFAKESQARAFLDDFLLNYVEVEVDEDGRIVAPNNILESDEDPSEPEICKTPQSEDDKPKGAYSEMVW